MDLCLDLADSFARVALSLEKWSSQVAGRELQQIIARSIDLFDKIKKLEVSFLTCDLNKFPYSK